ncbi:hypothetical protein POTOM_027788 [Populus tomentosa]|uniref:Uncharacterized protein n=1 Tax=Populus tomentosa TaxID=118781 RepID=A0A8X7ZDB4_POPTO|nr:hypothetical protein POTOM_027788 [Populus tomentosa]
MEMIPMIDELTGGKLTTPRATRTVCNADAFSLSMFRSVSMLAGGMLLWATTTELSHLTKNVHRHNVDSTNCPTAKTGLFGGAAFMALDASLFWLVCLMLTTNAREDYFDEAGEEQKGEYGQVLITDYETTGGGKA